ncbi:hypothetical protein [Fusobacterium varium]|uniref:hypothetical protein n=1 Tax=Fusobacterium varium TaxID=856 RepID=UPI00266C0BE5|nr:hypothetical protein [Fusobacterium varium]
MENEIYLELGNSYENIPLLPEEERLDFNKKHRRIFNRINLNYSEFILILDKILKDFLVFYKEKM